MNKSYKAMSTRISAIDAAGEIMDYLENRLEVRFDHSLRSDLFEEWVLIFERNVSNIKSEENKDE